MPSVVCVLQLYSDPPDEFCDPLTFVLMEDPVIMPTSNTSIDRSTIMRHLMSDPRDPFTNMPLHLGQLQPDDKLRAQIAAWKAARQKTSRASA
jgi:ubiquitin conjugation factor E4 B